MITIDVLKNRIKEEEWHVRNEKKCLDEINEEISRGITSIIEMDRLKNIITLHEKKLNIHHEILLALKWVIDDDKIEGNTHAL